MKYIMFFDESQGGGILSQHRSFEAEDDEAARAAAHRFIAENNGKNGYRALTLTHLERAGGGYWMTPRTPVTI